MDMKTIIPIILVGGVALWFFKRTEVKGYSNLVVRVYDDTTNEAIPGASVTVIGTTKYTNSYGSVTFTHLETLPTSVQVAATGYYGQSPIIDLIDGDNFFIANLTPM
jgi:hypothetical protein